MKQFFTKLRLHPVNWRIAFIALAVLVVVVGVGVGAYIVGTGGNRAGGGEAEGRKILAKVAKLYDVPTDEQPTVAEINDVEKLKKMPFYAKAKPGDYLVLYPKARIAILYRVSQNKLMNVAPIQASPTQTVR